MTEIIQFADKDEDISFDVAFVSSNPACPLKTLSEPQTDAGKQHFTTSFVDSKAAVAMKADSRKVAESYSFTVTMTAEGGASGSASGSVTIKPTCETALVTDFQTTWQFDVPEKEKDT